MYSIFASKTCRACPSALLPVSDRVEFGHTAFDLSVQSLPPGGSNFEPEGKFPIDCISSTAMIVPRQEQRDVIAAVSGKAVVDALGMFKQPRSDIFDE